MREGSKLHLIDRIEIDPRVCNGKPVIKGTRIPISVILEQIASGESWAKLLAGYASGEVGTWDLSSLSFLAGSPHKIKRGEKRAKQEVD